MTCASCRVTLTAAEVEHGLEGLGHEGVCCDCFNLECGMPLIKVNERRVSRGRAPLAEIPR